MTQLTLRKIDKNTYAYAHCVSAKSRERVHEEKESRRKAAANFGDNFLLADSRNVPLDGIDMCVLYSS